MEFTWYGISTGNNCVPRRIDNYSFIYVISGKGVFHIHNKTFHLQSDDMFVLFPDDLHSYYSHEDDPWELVWFGITGNSVSTLIEKSGISTQKPVLKRVNTPSVYTIMMEIVSILEKREQENYFFFLSNFYSLLGHISNCTDNIPASAKTPESIIKDATHFLELNYVHDIDMSTLASHFGYTRTYFATLFKEVTARTPVEYLTGIRLKKACSLLQNSNLSIQEISNSIGYQDSFYFSKLFRRYYGLSPSQHRNLL